MPKIGKSKELLEEYQRAYEEYRVAVQNFWKAGPLAAGQPEGAPVRRTLEHTQLDLDAKEKWKDECWVRYVQAIHEESQESIGTWTKWVGIASIAIAVGTAIQVIKLFG